MPLNLTHEKMIYDKFKFPGEGEAIIKYTNSTSKECC